MTANTYHSMNEQIHLTRKERAVYFYKLLLMYTGGVLLLGLIIFWNSFSSLGASSNDWKSRYNEREDINRRQIEAVRLIDSMLITMNMLKGDSRQTFLEKDLQVMAKQLGALYNGQEGSDQRALCFVQASSFMTLRLEDILTINKKQSNVNLFEKQLNDCKIGYKPR